MTCRFMVSVVLTFIARVGQNHIHIRCIYGTFGREITKLYGVHKRLRPTLFIVQIHFMHNHVCAYDCEQPHDVQRR